MWATKMKLRKAQIKNSRDKEYMFTDDISDGIEGSAVGPIGHEAMKNSVTMQRKMKKAKLNSSYEQLFQGDEKVRDLNPAFCSMSRTSTVL